MILAGRAAAVLVAAGAVYRSGALAALRSVLGLLAVIRFRISFLGVAFHTVNLLPT